MNQFDNAGQVCLAGTRLLIERSIYDDFIDRFTDAATAIRQGDPREETTDLGPLITRAISSGSTDSSSVRKRPVRDSSSAAGSPRSSVVCITGRRSSSTHPPGQNPHEGGLRAGPHGTALRGRGRGGRARERHRLRLGRDRLHLGPRPCPAGLRAARRWDGMGQLLLRARPERSVRWLEGFRDRSRGRRVELRFLLGREEHGRRARAADLRSSVGRRAGGEDLSHG